MSLLFRAVTADSKAASQMTAAADAAGGKNTSPSVDSIKRFAQGASSASSMAQCFLRDLRNRPSSPVWQMVECGYTDAHFAGGPLEFYCGGPALSNVPKDRRSFSRYNPSARTDDDNTNILGVLLSHQLGQTRSLGSYVSIIGIQNSERHVDLVAPFTSAELMVGLQPHQAIGYPVAVAEDLLQLGRFILSSPTLRTSAQHMCILVTMVPAIDADNFAALRPKTIDFMNLTNGYRLLLVSQPLHGSIAGIALEGKLPERASNSTITNVLQKIHALRQTDTTVVLRVPPNLTNDSLNILSIAETLAARPVARTAAPPNFADRAKFQERQPSRSIVDERLQHAQQQAALLQMAAQDSAMAAESVDVLLQEIDTLDSILANRTKEIQLAQRLISDRSALRGVMNFSSRSVERSLHTVLAQSNEARKMQRVLLGLINETSDTLRVAATATEQSRRAAVYLASQLKTMADRRDRAVSDMHHASGRRDTLETELNAMKIRLAALEAAAIEQEKIAESGAYEESEKVAGQSRSKIDDFAAETATILRGLHKAAAESSSHAEAQLTQKQRDSRNFLDEVERGARKEEDATAALKSQVNEATVRLEDATVACVAAKRAADEYQQQCDEAQKSVDQYDAGLQRVAKGREAVQALRQQCDQLEHSVKELHRQASHHTSRIHKYEGNMRRIDALRSDAAHRHSVRQRECFVALEGSIRADLVSECHTERLELLLSHRRSIKAIVTTDGSRAAAPPCRTCYLIGLDMDKVRKLELSCANDEARIKAALNSAQHEASAMVETHAEELRQTQALIEAAGRRVHVLRSEASARQAEARRCVTVEEERFESLALELMRQLHQEVAGAIHRLDGKLGKAGDDQASTEKRVSSDAIEPINVDDTAADVAKLYLQWCEAVDEARDSESRAATTRQQLMRVEHALAESTAQLAADRQLASKLEVSVKETESALQSLEAQADSLDQNEMQQRANIEAAIRTLHEQGVEQLRITEREISLADAAITSLKAQLADLRREANSVSSKLETAGEPVSSLHKQVTDLRRNNDLIAVQLHMADSHALQHKSAALSKSPRTMTASTDWKARPTSPPPPPSFTATGSSILSSMTPSRMPLPYTTGLHSTTALDRYGDAPSGLQRESAVSMAQRILDSRRQL